MAPHPGRSCRVRPTYSDFLHPKRIAYSVQVPHTSAICACNLWQNGSQKEKTPQQCLVYLFGASHWDPWRHQRLIAPRTQKKNSRTVWGSCYRFAKSSCCTCHRASERDTWFALEGWRQISIIYKWSDLYRPLSYTFSSIFIDLSLMLVTSIRF